MSLLHENRRLWQRHVLAETRRNIAGLLETLNRHHTAGGPQSPCSFCHKYRRESAVPMGDRLYFPCSTARSWRAHWLRSDLALVPSAAGLSWELCPTLWCCCPSRPLTPLLDVLQFS